MKKQGNGTEAKSFVIGGQAEVSAKEAAAMRS